MMNKNLQQFCFLLTHYSIDEQMVPYTGKNSGKQTRTKSIWFGYKHVMCLDDGYLYFVDPYFGKKNGGGMESKNLSAHWVLDCVTEIDDWGNKEVLFNNWLLFFSLITVLKEPGILATGPIHVNYLGKYLLINKKDLKQQESLHSNLLQKGMCFLGMIMVQFWLFQKCMDSSLWSQ